MNIVFPYCPLQFAISVLPKESLLRFVPKYSLYRLIYLLLFTVSTECTFIHADYALSLSSVTYTRTLCSKNQTYYATTTGKS